MGQYLCVAMAVFGAQYIWPTLVSCGGGSNDDIISFNQRSLFDLRSNNPILVNK